MTTFLVTGCLGFIGSSLVDALLAQGHDVVGLDNESTGIKANIQAMICHPNFKLIAGDIRNVATCVSACQGVTYVLHQAALGSVPESIDAPDLYHAVNCTGTLNIFEAARQAGVSRVIYASSSSVYGDTPDLPKRETMPLYPKSPYATTKSITERYGNLYYRCYGLPTIGLRYFNVFGPRQNPHSQYAAVIPKFIAALLNNNSPVIYGDGFQTRDFTYIANVVQANLLACTAPDVALGEVVNVGSGTQLSLRTLANLVQSQMGSTAPIRFETARAGDVKDSLADIQRLRDWLGLWHPVSLEAGLTETIQWYAHRLA